MSQQPDSTFSARSAHTRIGWCVEVLKLGETLELHLFKRKYGGDIVLYSPSGSRSGTKVPFGNITKCEFVVGQNVKTKDMTESFQLTNEDNRKGQFDLTLLDMFLRHQNEFTVKLGQLLVDKKYKLLAMYLSLLVRSKSFKDHNADLHQDNGFNKEVANDEEEDMANLFGSKQEYEEIMRLADENATLSDIGQGSQPSKRKITDFFSKKPPKKLSKSEVVEKMFNDELEDEIGLEKSHMAAFEGRADIPIRNISVSPLLGLPVNQSKVRSIQKSMIERFDPSRAVLTVSPISGSTLDLSKVGEQKFVVVHGVHTLLAMQNLHAKGSFSKLLGIENESCLCFVVNLENKPAGHNYANLRANEIASKYQSGPTLQMLVFIFHKLKAEYKDVEKATEVIERISRLQKIRADELTAMRKICLWPDKHLDSLVTVLLRFEKYATLDAYDERSKASMRMGKPLKMDKTMMIMIGRCSSEYFENNVGQVLEKKISLNKLLKNSKKTLEVEKTNSSLLTLSNYQPLETLQAQYPDKFTSEKLKKYAGADVGAKYKNVQGDLLESYYKSVVEKKDESVTDKILVEEYEHLSDIRSDVLEKNDLVIIKLKTFSEEYIQYVVDNTGYVRKDMYAILILTGSGAEQMKVLSMVKELEGREKFTVMQIFFEKEMSVLGELGFTENVQCAVLMGKVQVHGNNIPVLFKNLEDGLAALIERLCPVSGKVCVVIGPKTAAPPIDHSLKKSWSSLIYYGDSAGVIKLKQKFVKERVAVHSIEDESIGEAENNDESNSGEKSSGGVYEFSDDAPHSSIARQSSTSKF